MVDVFAGSYNGFVLTENHYVFAWGLNKNGQLGLGDEEDRDRPTEVPALRSLKIVAIAGGDFHTLVLTASGELYGYARRAIANEGATVPNYHFLLVGRAIQPLWQHGQGTRRRARFVRFGEG